MEHGHLGEHCSTRGLFFIYGSCFWCSWKWVDKVQTEKGAKKDGDCCKNHSVWRVDPTFVHPNHFLQFPCLFENLCVGGDSVCETGKMARMCCLVGML